MAKINDKRTEFQKEQASVLLNIRNKKKPIEGNIIGAIYKNPESIITSGLSRDDFSYNESKVYFQIAYDLILLENKKVLDDITISMYLDNHPKLKNKYEEYGGYDFIKEAKEYGYEDNLEGEIKNLKKWNVLINMTKAGFPVKDRLSEFADMSVEKIYNEYETLLNHYFINAESDVKSYNVFDGIYQLIDELDSGSAMGMPLYNADLLTNEIAGLNIGNIYGLGANSGCGKSSMAFNWVVPSAIENNERVVFIINEEDQTKFQKDMIIWVANNIFKEELHKYELKNGHFSKEKKQLLMKCANWIDKKKSEKIFTVVPLEHYSVNIAIKIINKYSSLGGVKMFVLDTLKESFDASTDEIYKSMMRDMVKLYDTVKPSSKNVMLLVTYQLGKGSIKLRHLTNSEIGQAKSIVDVMSCNLMMRRPFEDEYTGGKNELQCWEPSKNRPGEKIPFTLDKSRHPMIIFVTKNRFGATDEKQIVASCDLSTNVCMDIGYTNVPEDY